MTESKDIEFTDEPSSIAKKAQYSDDIADSSHNVSGGFLPIDLPTELETRIAESVRETVEATEKHVDESIPSQIVREASLRHQAEIAHNAQEPIDPNYNPRIGTYYNKGRG